jgi:hypothetical protein
LMALLLFPIASGSRAQSDRSEQSARSSATDETL